VREGRKEQERKRDEKKENEQDKGKNMIDRHK
jgi:hypothetical protein